MLIKNKAILMVVLLFCLNLSVFSQTISLKLNNVTVLQAMEALKEKSGYSFVFESSDIDTRKKINIQISNQPVEVVVKQILAAQDVQYEIIGKNIVVKKQAKNPQVQPVQKSSSVFEVTGTVKDEKGEAVIGASVKLRVPNVGAVTDLNGRFRLVATARVDKPELVVSYVGYITQVVPLKKFANLEIILKEDSRKLGEVVITAMGIERKAKSLTYATQTVGGADFTRSKESNFINSLQGKAAGLTVTPNTSGGAGGGSSKIILRGQSSLTGNNQPLIVLDGVPLESGMSGQAGGNIVMGGARDGGDLLSMINPDDIATMTILKGPNAAALYGSHANNGVLVITTKRGREGKIRVDVSSNTTVETLNMKPRIQSVYGGEIKGYNMSLNGWGKKIGEETAEEMARIPYLTNSPVDNISAFFCPAYNTNNTVSINGGNENYQSYFSYGNTTARGLIPNNTFSRHNVLFKQSYLLFNKRVSADISLNYIHQNNKNQPLIGKALSPLLALYRTPRNIDMRYFAQNYQHKATADDPLLAATETANKKLIGQDVQTWPWFDQYVNNPYWLLHKSDNVGINDRLLSAITLKWIVNESLNLQTRFNLDQNFSRGFSSDSATLNIESRLKGGRCYQNFDYSSNLYWDYMGTYTKKIGENVDFNTTLGGSMTRLYNTYLNYTNYIDTAAIPNKFFPDNNRYNQIQSSVATSSRYGKDWTAAIFATMQIGLWDMVNLDGSYRMEWAQSFQQFAPVGYKMYDYYSVGGNVLLKEMFLKDVRTIDNLKLRTSYSVVGSPIPNISYSAYGIDFWTGKISPTPSPFDFPRPNLTQSIEVGLDGSLFNSKLNFDLTYYNSLLKNQFRWISTASGQTKPVNGGSVRNKGLEITASYKMAFTRDLVWTPGVTLAFNDNKVETMYTDENGRQQILEDGTKEFHFKQIAGKTYGDLYVNSFQRKADGTLDLTNDFSPKPVVGAFDTYAGNATARFTYGFNNTFRYKNFSLYMLLDGKIGGKVLSLTEADLDQLGLSERSATARLNSYYKTGTDADGNPKQILVFKLPDGQEVNTVRYFQLAGSNPNELYAYDATNMRLRELSLGYTFENLLGSSKSLTVGLVGKNLFFVYKKSPVDPDVSLSAGNGFGGIDVYSLPTTRNFALNLKMTF